MKITIRELPDGRHVAALPGAERIGPTCRTREEVEQQVKAYLERLVVADEATVAPEGNDPSATGTEEIDAPPVLPGVAVEEPEPPEGHYLRRHGLWFKLFDADGNQVGKAKRKAEDAVAQAN